MVGVSGPLLAYTPKEGTRFLIGLIVAGAAGSAMLGLVGVGIGLLLQHLLSWTVRLGLLVLWAALLAAADLSDRTPQWFRQVPQRLVRELRGGWLGTVWGFDLGLLVTTKKVTSLMWVALGGAVLLHPDLVPVCAVALGLTTSLSIVLWSWQVRGDTSCLMRRQRGWMTRVRWLSGATILLVGLLAAGQVV